mmetsp:Transcript_3716/g.7799  ORF Transcript_3716/g.7799 Transcript_3716/m.7799 type:complete len:219 (+) Transcript_3716:66-722(+)
MPPISTPRSSPWASSFVVPAPPPPPQLDPTQLRLPGNQERNGTLQRVPADSNGYGKGGHRPIRPDLKSRLASMISLSVFMTKGPRAAIGSLSGWPESTMIWVFSSLALRTADEPCVPKIAIPCGPIASRPWPSPTTMPPLRTKMIVLWPSGKLSRTGTFGVSIRMSHRSIGVCVMAAPALPWKLPAITLNEPTTGAGAAAHASSDFSPSAAATAASSA